MEHHSQNSVDFFRSLIRHFEPESGIPTDRRGCQCRLRVANYSGVETMRQKSWENVTALYLTVATAIPEEMW